MLVSGFGVIDVIQFANALLYTCFQVEQTYTIHLAVHSRMTCGALFHELREYACMIGFLPLFADVIEDALTLGLALPIGNYLPLIGVNVLLRDVVGLQLSGVERVQVLNRMAGEFWECGYSLRHRTALTHNKFVSTNVECLSLTYLIEVACSQHSYGHGAIVLLIEIGFDECAFDAQRGRGVHVLLAQTLDAWVHATFVLGIFKREIHDWNGNKGEKRMLLIFFGCIYLGQGHGFLDST